MSNFLNPFKKELQSELIDRILPFWMNKMVDEKQGGYYGQMTGNDILVPDAPKGGVLNARILWTFSSAALQLKDKKYLPFAKRAKDYFLSHFFDKENGGTYWMIHADGTPADTKKQIYSQAFSIYALVEYYRATSDVESLDKAIELFYLIEKHSFDHRQNGYFEAYSSDWHLLEDLRLSDKDANEKKTMNTHLHVLEAYTNLYRVWKDESLAKQLKNLIELFLSKIINPKNHHLDLFFDENWVCKSTLISYGHDIEASWLLEEAAVVLADADLLTDVRQEVELIAEAALEGLQANGSMINERNFSTGHFDTNCDWWPQAEAMIGFYNAFELTGESLYLDKVLANWEFIKTFIIDQNNGEWHWAVNSEGEPDLSNDKAGFWKCPYHNSRMCLELLKRMED